MNCFELIYGSLGCVVLLGGGLWIGLRRFCFGFFWRFRGFLLLSSFFFISFIIYILVVLIGRARLFFFRI